MKKRKHISSKIESLDWKTDYEEIVYLLTAFVFPWDYQKALEFALFRTYAVPSVSKLLSKTGEFRDRGATNRAGNYVGYVYGDDKEAERERSNQNNFGFRKKLF